jgi:hypothetical protein
MRLPMFSIRPRREDRFDSHRQRFRDFGQVDLAAALRAALESWQPKGFASDPMLSVYI